MMSTKSVYGGTDHYFFRGGGLGFFQTKFLHSKTAEKKLCKGSHGEKSIKQVLCAI